MENTNAEYWQAQLVEERYTNQAVKEHVKEVQNYMVVDSFSNVKLALACLARPTVNALVRRLIKNQSRLLEGNVNVAYVVCLIVSLHAEMVECMPAQTPSLIAKCKETLDSLSKKDCSSSTVVLNNYVGFSLSLLFSFDNQQEPGLFLFNQKLLNMARRIMRHYWDSRPMSLVPLLEEVSIFHLSVTDKEDKPYLLRNCKSRDIEHLMGYVASGQFDKYKELFNAMFTNVISNSATSSDQFTLHDNLQVVRQKMYSYINHYDQTNSLATRLGYLEIAINPQMKEYRKSADMCLLELAKLEPRREELQKTIMFLASSNIELLSDGVLLLDLNTSRVSKLRKRVLMSNVAFAMRFINDCQMFYQQLASGNVNAEVMDQEIAWRTKMEDSAIRTWDTDSPIYIVKASLDDSIDMVLTALEKTPHSFKSKAKFIMEFTSYLDVLKLAPDELKRTIAFQSAVMDFVAHLEKCITARPDSIRLSLGQVPANVTNYTRGIMFANTGTRWA
jgi:hypothetical protein